MATATAPPVVGEIEAGKVYTLAEFKRRTSLGDWAINTAKRRGLKIRRAHRRVFVHGSDWLAYLDKIDAEGELDV